MTSERLTEQLPLCACAEFYESHPPECPAQTAYNEALAEIRRLQARWEQLKNEISVPRLLSDKQLESVFVLLARLERE